MLEPWTIEDERALQSELVWAAYFSECTERKQHIYDDDIANSAYFLRERIPPTEY